MSAMLVIGYGNELRSDDGVGPKVAVAIAAMQLPSVRAIACHQLTPELAEPIASAAAVVFVDAACDSGDGVQIRMIQPSEAGRITTHAGDPRSLLALARALFDRRPPAWMITIHGVTFDFSEQLSPQAQKGLVTAIEEIKRLWTRYYPGGTSQTATGAL